MAFKASGSIPFISTKTELQSQGFVVLCPIENEDLDTEKWNQECFRSVPSPFSIMMRLAFLNATW